MAAPPPRIGAALAYDGVSGNLLLFSGVRGDGTSQACATWVFDDTWTWDGHRWTQLHPASPPGRSFGSLAFDDSTRQTILFGGGAANSDPARNDTWTWDGTTWTERRLAISPPHLEQASVTYDAATQSVVLLGAFGVGSQTWTWNGTGWAQAPPPHAPSARLQAAMAYDAVRSQVVLFGGYQSVSVSLNDTWTWNGIDWQQQHPQTSPPSLPGVAAYDPVHRLVVLFAFGQTWTWDGGNWSQQHPAVSPLPRLFASMAYDQAVGKVVLFGGKIGVMSGGLLTETVTNETWLWDGTTWTLAA